MIHDPLIWSTCGDDPASAPVKAFLVIGRVVVVSLLAADMMLGQSLGLGKAVAEPGGTQRGFALIWNPPYDGPQIAQSLNEMAEVGATWVQFTPAWSQNARNASAIARSPLTMSDDNLERAIALAHKYRLKVFLIPHLYLPAPQSRSTIRPDDRGAWFASYTTFISHYAAMAQRLGVEQFSVGSELASISDDRPGWLQVIREVRDRYQGTVLYGAEPDEATRVPFWDALDLIGIDAYIPLSDAPTTDVSALQRSWEPIRAEMAAGSARYGRKILFTEAGYTSQEGTTTAPNDWMLGTPPSESEQAAAYLALLATFTDQPWWEGVYWWVWNALPDDGSDHATNYSPRGKAAERVIREWWQ
jgi:hypothetical protein